MKSRGTMCLLAVGTGVALARGALVTVAFEGAGSGDVRLLVDATGSGADFDHRAVEAPAGVATLGEIPSGSRGEVIAFTDRRPPTAFPDIDWAQPPSSLAFDPEIVASLHVWIVRGPFLAVKEEAMRHVATARAIFRDERLGLNLGPTTYHDATGVDESFLDFDCGQQVALEQAAGKVAGAINVYYVDSVEGWYGYGHRCAIGSGFAVLAALSGGGLLAHELGHNLGLEHIDYLPDFDESNVMHPDSDEREFLTEGQSFRAVHDPASALNLQYGAREGRRQRFCDTTPNSPAEAGQCPPIGLRLWADGAKVPR